MGDTSDNFRDDSLWNKAFLQVSTTISTPTNELFWRAVPLHLGSTPELFTKIEDSCSRRPGIIHQAAKSGHGFRKFKSRSSMKLRGGPALFAFPEYYLGTETRNSARSRYRCRRSWGFEPNWYHGSLPNGSMARGSKCSSIGNGTRTKKTLKAGINW